MTTTKRRSPVSTTVPKTLVEQATLTLKDLPEKPKEGLSLREAVERLHGDIVSAIAKGYSHEDVAALLTSQGVDINTSSLKYYLTRLGKKNAPSAPAKTRQPSRRKAKNDASSEQTDPLNGAGSTSADETTPEAPDVLVDLPQLDVAATAESEAPAKRRSSRSTTQTRTKAPGRTSSRTAAKTKPTAGTTSVKSRRRKAADS